MSEQSLRTSDAVEAFIASLRQRSVPINTIKSYAHDLRLFVQVVPADVPAVTAETLQAFLASFNHLSAATRRRRYCTLCAFYHWLVRHGVVATNPMERLDSIEQVQRELILTQYGGVVECGKAGLEKGDHDAKTTAKFYC